MDTLSNILNHFISLSPFTKDVYNSKDDEDSEGDGEEEEENRGDDLGKRAGADVLQYYEYNYILLHVCCELR